MTVFNSPATWAATFRLRGCFLPIRSFLIERFRRASYAACQSYSSLQNGIAVRTMQCMLPVPTSAKPLNQLRLSWRYGVHFGLFSRRIGLCDTSAETTEIQIRALPTPQANTPLSPAPIPARHKHEQHCPSCHYPPPSIPYGAPFVK